VTAGGGATGVATSVAHRLPLLLASSSLVILGSLVLRLFIVYAGQLPA
jgi:formate-dependent nitrite reductase membrane component NrfD